MSTSQLTLTLPPLQLKDLITPSSIHSQLSSLSQFESHLSDHLSNAISPSPSNEHVNIPNVSLTKRGTLDVVGDVEPVLKRLEKKAKKVDRRLTETADVAERIGGVVGRLDEEMSRVKQCIEMVQAVQDLKSSLTSLSISISKKDWESATRHYHRAKMIDREKVLQSDFAEAVVPTANLPLPPIQTLTNFRNELLETFLDNFRNAALERDEARTSRFFKLFPMIGEERSGLDAYAEFVCGIVNSRMSVNLGVRPNSPAHFSSTLLTSLFENIAMIVSQHQPVVEKYYGTWFDDDNGTDVEGGMRNEERSEVEGESTSIGIEKKNSKMETENERKEERNIRGRRKKRMMTMERVMMKMQEECCDRLGEKIIERWEEDRKVGRKVEDIKSHLFKSLASFQNPTSSVHTSSLIAGGNSPTMTRPSTPILTSASRFQSALRQQTLVPGQNSLYAGGGGGGGSSSSSTTNANITSSSTATGGGGGGSGTGGDEEGLGSGESVKEIDAALGELATISNRWKLYERFLYGRLGGGRTAVEDDVESTTTTHKASLSTEDGISKQPQSEQQGSGQQQQPYLELVEESELNKLVRRKLEDVYKPLEVWYLRNSVEKAHQVDEPDFSTRPLLSSSLDDTFYILKKVLHRLLSTSSLLAFQLLVPSIKEILLRDYGQVIRRRLEGVYSGMTSTGSGGGGGGYSGAIGIGGVGMGITVGGSASGGSGGSGGGGSDKEKERRNQFMVYLNDLDMGAEYVVRVVDELTESEIIKQTFPPSSSESETGARSTEENNGGELAKVIGLLKGLKREVEDGFRGIVKSGLDQIFTQLVRPRLRPLMVECYKDVTYMLADEDAHAESEYRDLVRKRFVAGWEGLVGPFKEAFTSTNYHIFFTLIVVALVKPWETIIRGMKFTELGALRFDRDLRSIMTYLSSQTNFGVGILRDAIARLQHICALLTLESPDEADADDVGTGRLTQAEIKAVLAQRV